MIFHTAFSTILHVYAAQMLPYFEEFEQHVNIFMSSVKPKDVGVIGLDWPQPAELHLQSHTPF